MYRAPLFLMLLVITGYAPVEDVSKLCPVVRNVVVDHRLRPVIVVYESLFAMLLEITNSRPCSSCLVVRNDVGDPRLSPVKDVYESCDVFRNDAGDY